MAISLADVSRRLEMPEEELVRQSLRSFLTRELQRVEWDIADIRERYAVSSRADLEAAIKNRTIYSHPAWEDLIHWENLEAYAARLRDIAEETHAAT